MTARITVLMPLHAPAHFLPAALNSLRAQTLTDWQAVLLPDNADLQAQVQSLMGDDPRLQMTLHSACDSILSQAASRVDSEFFCVFDAADLLAGNALAALCAALEAHTDAGMAYSRHQLIDAQGRVLGPGPLCELPYSCEALLFDFMTGPLRLLRTSAYHAAGGYQTTFPDALDYDLCLRLSETAPILPVPQPLYGRRIYPQAPEVARWAEGIQARYDAFVAAVQRRGLDADYDTALKIDSWHILQPRLPFGGIPGI